uniref:Ubiquitin-like protein 7 n=1 Tax=Tetraodon nigroviridis TaxID=99883 RepID=H3D339_TETNG
MASSEWQLSLKLMEQPKSTFHFPEMMPGDVSPGEYRVATLKQLVAAQLPDSVPDPDLIELVHCGRKLKDDLTLDACGILSGSTIHILKETWPDPESSPSEPVNRATAAREFRVFHAALHSLNSTYRDSVYKMLTNKESLDQIIVLRGVRSDPVALGVLQDKDLFVQFTDPNMLDPLIGAHPALVNAIILVLHSVAGSMPAQSSGSSSRNVSSGSYSDMPGRGFMFEGMSDDEEDFQSGSPAGAPGRTMGSAGMRPVSLGHSGAGPRPITQSELATALALATRPKAAPSLQPHPTSNAPPMPAGTPVSNDLFSQALQQALQASNMSALQGRWQSQMQQLRDMGIQDEELTLRALQATDGDIQAALELIFAGGPG